MATLDHDFTGSGAKGPLFKRTGGPSIETAGMILANHNGGEVHCCDWRSLLDVAPVCDLLCVDAPYSEKTQNGHDVGVAGLGRRSIAYAAWTADDVRLFVGAWSPRTRGWFLSVTDDTFAPVWRAALESAGRYAFAAVPFVAPGSRVRLTGDGPSSWTTWIVVARPRTPEFARWGTLPGAYVLPEGHGGQLPVVGGKPVWLMQRLVEDYSRPGDLVCDPCCGAGTTAIGAIRSGRRAIVGDISREHAEMAAAWVEHPQWRSPISREREDDRQLGLFGDARRTA